MTRKSPSAPRQVELTNILSDKLNSTPFLFVSDSELTSQEQLTEGDWLRRVTTFMDDPESGIGSDETEREFALAMITRRHKRNLPKHVVARLTKCLETVKRYPPGAKTHRLERVKRDIDKLQGK